MNTQMRVISDLERPNPERGIQNEEAMVAQDLHVEHEVCSHSAGGCNRLLRNVECRRKAIPWIQNPICRPRNTRKTIRALSRYVVAFPCSDPIT